MAPNASRFQKALSISILPTRRNITLGSKNRLLPGEDGEKIARILLNTDRNQGRQCKAGRTSFDLPISNLPVQMQGTAS